MEHEGLRGFLAHIDGVDSLLVAHRPERRHRERLRLPPGEERRTVRSRQKADLARDVADVVHAATIDALPVLENAPAHRLLFQLSQSGADISRAVRVVGFEPDGEILAQGGQGSSALLLVRDPQRFAHLAGRQRRDRLHDLRVGSDGLILEGLRGAGLPDQLALEPDQIGDGLLSDLHRLEEFILGGLQARALDHHDRVLGTGDDDLHVAQFEVIEGRVHEPLAFATGDPHAGDGPVPWDRGQEEGRRCPQHADDVRVVLLVRGDDEADDLGVVPIVRGEERPEGPVDLPRGDGLLLAGPRFPLDEPAGELAGGVGLLAVLDREGEKGKMRRLAVRRGGDEHCGLPVLHIDGAIGLPGHPARLEDQGPSVEFGFNSVCHSFSSLLSSGVALRDSARRVGLSSGRRS